MQLNNQYIKAYLERLSVALEQVGETDDLARQLMHTHGRFENQAYFQSLRDECVELYYAAGSSLSAADLDVF